LAKTAEASRVPRRRAGRRYGAADGHGGGWWCTARRGLDACGSHKDRGSEHRRAAKIGLEEGRCRSAPTA